MFFWGVFALTGLEINERPLKKPFLNLGSLSISDSDTGKGIHSLSILIRRRFGNKEIRK